MSKKPAVLKVAAPTSEEPIESLASDAYRKYGEYVLEERAIPALHDGLKPVQRRILYAMWDLGIRPSSNYRKSALVVGDVMGRFHPHGDKSIYDAMVHLVNPEPLVSTKTGAHPFSPIDPQGNFGAPPRKLHPAAAMRYTEVRLSKLGAILFECLDVADTIPNFSGEYQEPVLIPTRIPVLLLFGASGVGVGASTDIPPHGLKAVLRVTKYVLEKGLRATLSKAVEILGGPDYGHSYMTSPKDVLEDMYREGKGTVRFMCDHHIRRGKDCHELVITSFAPGFNLISDTKGAGFLDKMAALVEQNKIIACNNETDSEGPRITVLFRDPTVIEERVLPLLKTFQHYSWNVIDKLAEQDEEVDSDGDEEAHPKFIRVNLLSYINVWLDWRRSVETKMLELERKQTMEQLAREQAKLAASQNAEKLGRIMGQKIAYDVKKGLIKAQIRFQWKSGEIKPLTDEQIEYLLDQKIRSMDRMNEDAQTKVVQGLLDQLKRIADDLAHIDRVILGHLNRVGTLMAKAMESWTGTKMVYGEPVLEIPETTMGSGYWHMNALGFVRAYETLPTKGGGKFPEGHLCLMTDQITVVEAFGTAHTLKSAFLTQGRSDYKDVLAIVAGTFPVLLVMDDKGNVGCIEHPPARLKDYLPLYLTTEDTLVAAWGCYDSDTVYAFGSNTWEAIKVEKLGTKRPGSQGRKLLTRARNVPRVFVVPAGGLLVANGVGKIAPEAVQSKHEVFAVGKSNYIITNSGKKLVANAVSTASWASSDGLTACFILR